MKQTTKVIEFKNGDELEFSLTVAGPANYEMGLVRTFLQEELKLKPKEVEGGSGGLSRVHLASRRFMAMQFYPSMVAAVIEQTGFKEWPPTFDDFLHGLPESFMTQWEQAAFALNPTWRLRAPVEVKKKGSGSAE